jgi:CBS-domain-containing membrane protein
MERGMKVSKLVFGKKSVDKSQIFWSWLGAFAGIVLVAIISRYFLEGVGLTLVIGSFGASAVLLYGACESPLAQPRNLIGGHFLSALVGVTVMQLMPDTLWLAAPLSVATAIAVMQLTDTLHPPGGATALIAVIGGAQVVDLGYLYAFIPVTAGATVMLMVALIVNRLAPNRSYPQ